MSLYRAYFIPNRLDPLGEHVGPARPAVRPTVRPTMQGHVPVRCRYRDEPWLILQARNRARGNDLRMPAREQARQLECLNFPPPPPRICQDGSVAPRHFKPRALCQLGPIGPGPRPEQPPTISEFVECTLIGSGVPDPKTRKMRCTYDCGLPDPIDIFIWVAPGDLGKCNDFEELWVNDGK